MDDSTTEISREIREALEELSSYLSDSIPPLFFAGSIRALFAVSPEIIAAQVVAWSMSQHAPDDQLATADYIFHAAKKIHLLAELELVPAEAIKEFLVRLRPALLEGCPEADRAGLAHDLDRLDLQVTASPLGSVDVVYRRAGSETKARARTRDDARAEASTDGEELREMSRSFGEGLKKLDLLLGRIGGGAVPADAASASGLAATAVSAAAVGLESSVEMERFLEGLKRRGLPATSEDLLAMLTRNLPDWAPPAAAEGESESPQAAVRAMRRFISLAKDQAESQERFDELADTAVGEFNEGSLGRAVTLLDLAGSMIAKKEVDAVFAESVQRRVFAKINTKLLRELMESEDKHHLLRRFVGFFREFDPKQLLLELEEEESRDRRRFLLDLLIVQGASAREAVLTDLTEASTGNAVFPWYYKRNLIHLLRRIPGAGEAPIEAEIDVLVGLWDPTDPLPLLRETLGALGQMRHDRAVTALAVRINELEEALLGEREMPHEPEQLRFLLDSVVKSLVRMGLPEARRCVVAHGLKRQSELGDAGERLSWLTDQDLSGEPDLVDRLVREVRAELPKKMFGMTLKTSRKDQVIHSILTALASTDTPAVRDLYGEVARDWAGQPFADTAARQLQRLRAGGKGQKPQGSTLSGDLGIFGLPNLLQNLADSQIGGLLTVLDGQGAAAAQIWLEKGKVLGARRGHLRGEVAVYQLLEDPAPGRFELTTSEAPIPHEVKTAEELSIQSILFEGIRRYDEFKRAAGVVPDDARFQHAGGQPTLPEGESDAILFKEVWQRAAAGRSPVECEQELPVDRYRIRCLFEHWLGEGVLVAATSNQQTS